MTNKPAMSEHLQALLRQIPQQSQRQDSTHAQLSDLHAFAIRLGLYDAADAIRAIIDRQHLIRIRHDNQ